MCAVLIAMAVGCSKRGDPNAFAKQVESEFRAKTFAATVTMRGSTMVIANWRLGTGETFCAAGFEQFLRPVQVGSETESIGPVVDFARARAIGIKRIECEDGRGGVIGVDLPLSK